MTSEEKIAFIRDGYEVMPASNGGVVLWRGNGRDSSRLREAVSFSNYREMLEWLTVSYGLATEFGGAK